MSRPLRIAYHEAWYHIMNRGLQPSFATQKQLGIPSTLSLDHRGKQFAV